MGNRCSSDRKQACPWLVNLDADISVAETDFERRIFFGKKKAEQKVGELIAQREFAQQAVEMLDCPGAEYRDNTNTLHCGILVVNSEMMKLKNESSSTLNEAEEG